MTITPSTDVQIFVPRIEGGRRRGLDGDDGRHQGSGKGVVRAGGRTSKKRRSRKS